MVRHFIILLLVLCTNIIHAQSLTESVKNHVMGMTVVSAKEMGEEIESNRIKLNNIFNQIKEKGGHPFVLIRGEITDMSELNVGCKIKMKGNGWFQEFHLYSAIDEDVYNYSKGQTVYALISPYSLGQYDSYFDIAIVSETKEGLSEKIAAIVNGIMDYPNKRGLLQHLLEVKSSSFEHIGMDNSISALINYFNLYKR